MRGVTLFFETRCLLKSCSPLPNSNGRKRLLPVPVDFLVVITRMPPSPPPSPSSSRARSNCTHINPFTQKSTCQTCPSPAFPSSSFSSSPLRWSCKACTFSNAYNNSRCEICGTGVPSSSLCFPDTSNDDMDASVGSVFLPLQRCQRKRHLMADIVVDKGDSGNSKELGELCGLRSMKKVASGSGDSSADSVPLMLKILTYNVWFREDMEMHKRMEAIGNLIQQHSPDIICFQEVTPNIYDKFRQSSWWKAYSCSVSNEMAKMRPYFCMQLSKLSVKAFNCKPFSNSIMGRELCIAEVGVEAGKTLVVATSHLESPCPAPPRWDQMFSKERIAQAKEAINHLKDSANAIFGGDMNWDDKLDGAFPASNGWIDVWTELRPRENGWTYDTKANPMLSGNRALQKRLDRFICKLNDFKISHIDMVGLEPIPGLSYCKEKKVRRETQKLVLPVLPSDHFGLLLTISSL